MSVTSIRRAGTAAAQSIGTCVGGDFKLQARHDDARIEVEYEVDTTRVGRIWSVTLTDNGVTVFAGKGQDHPRRVVPSQFTG